MDTLEQKQRYLESATEGLERQLSAPIMAEMLRPNGSGGIEVNGLLADCAGAIEVLYQLDNALHANAASFVPEAWESEEQRLEERFAATLKLARRSIHVADKLVATGLDLPDLARLQQQADRAEKDANWPDYGDTEKFRAVVEAAERDYRKGRTEDGGWE